MKNYATLKNTRKWWTCTCCVYLWIPIFCYLIGYDGKWRRMIECRCTSLDCENLMDLNEILSLGLIMREEVFVFSKKTSSYNNRLREDVKRSFVFFSPKHLSSTEIWFEEEEMSQLNESDSVGMIKFL